MDMLDNQKLDNRASDGIRLAVILPCYNEELTIAETISGFREVLPGAVIYVCDNNSNDNSLDIAAEAGAIVISEPRQGKGEAVRRLFADVEADVYVMADADATYDPKSAPEMVQRLIRDDLDVVIGNRLNSIDNEQFRRGHQFGNRLFSKIVQFFFNSPIKDLLSGYRVMSNRFVKTFPAESRGFEIETELTVFALEARLPMKEIVTEYSARPEGSKSKLSTWRDGILIFVMILTLFRDVKPMQFFVTISTATMLIALALAYPILQTFLEVGEVPRIPTAIVIVGLFILVFVFLSCGIILERISANRRYFHRLAYLRMTPKKMLGIKE